MTALINSFYHFGGLVDATLIDHMKTVVIGGDGEGGMGVQLPDARPLPVPRSLHHPVPCTQTRDQGLWKASHNRGKIERFFRTVRDQFLVEVPHSDISSIEVLQSRFQGWVEQVYHKEIHSETCMSPLERFSTTPKIPDLELVREAFLFSETRVVTKTSTVSLYDNTYEVDAALIGRKIELVFDPFDLSEISVRYQGRDFGLAVPFKITRHSHPAASKHEPKEVVPTGIDYLKILEDQHQRDLGTSIGYRDLGANDQVKGDVS